MNSALGLRVAAMQTALNLIACAMCVAQHDMRRMQGTWVVTHMEADGKAVKVNPTSMMITGDMFVSTETIEQTGRFILDRQRGTFEKRTDTLNGEPSPYANVRYLGRFEFGGGGNEFSECSTLRPSESIPEDMRANAGSGAVLSVWRRQSQSAPGKASSWTLARRVVNGREQPQESLGVSRMLITNTNSDALVAFSLRSAHTRSGQILFDDHALPKTQKPSNILLSMHAGAARRRGYIRSRMTPSSMPSI